MNERMYFYQGVLIKSEEYVPRGVPDVFMVSRATYRADWYFRTIANGMWQVCYLANLPPLFQLHLFMES